MPFTVKPAPAAPDATAGMMKINGSAIASPYLSSTSACAASKTARSRLSSSATSGSTSA